MAPRRISGTVRRGDRETDPSKIVRVGGRPLFLDPNVDPVARRTGQQLDVEALRNTAEAREFQRQAANRALVNRASLQRLIGGSPTQLENMARGRVLQADVLAGRPLSKEQKERLGITDAGDGSGRFIIGKGGRGGGLSASELAKMQWEQVKRNWEIEDRAAEQAAAAAAGQRQRSAYENIADIYRQQGEQGFGADLESIQQVYGGQQAEAERRREAALASLAAAVQEAGGSIDAATAEALQNLVSTQAYSDVPLVELAPMQNLFTQALAAEGATGAGVEQQRAQDAALAAQFAQLARGAAQQLNVGEQNYLAALRNALVGGQAAGRSAVAARAAAERGGLESQFADIMGQITASRADAEREAERRRQEALLRAAQAMAEAEQFAPRQGAAVNEPAPAEDWMQYFR